MLGFMKNIHPNLHVAFGHSLWGAPYGYVVCFVALIWRSHFTGQYGEAIRR